MPEAWRWNPRKRTVNHLLGGPQRHTGLIGGSRSGKTALICRAILTRALRTEHSRHLMARLRANAARASLWLDTIPKVARVCYPGVKLQDQRQDGFIRLPNRSEIWIGGLDDKDRVEKILGNEYASIYFNECSQIPYASVEVVLTRLAQTTPLVQRAYYDLNPVGRGHWTHRLLIEKVDPTTRLPLIDPDNYQHAFLNPLDNQENLTPEYLASLAQMPERRRRRFFLGEYVDEIEGALWTLDLLERARVSPEDVPRNLKRVVVAVDPSGTDGEDDARSDDVGILVLALGPDNHVYVLADLTCNLPPEGWGRRVVWAYERYRADAVVAEGNFGGAMVRFVIQTAAGQNPVPVYLVQASRGKVVRAEPVSALYGDPSPLDPEHPGLPCRVHHVWGDPETADFNRLEDELLQFSTFGYQGTRSPNRADACVAEGSLVETNRGEIPIELVQPGDLALTRRGFRKVLAARMTSSRTLVYTVVTTAGRFTATPDHLVWTEEHGWYRVDALVRGNMLCHRSNLLFRSSSTDENIVESRNPTSEARAFITAAWRQSIANKRFFMSMFGVTQTTGCLLAEVFSFTTSTVIRLTTIWQTSRELPIASTPFGTGKIYKPLGQPMSAERFWLKLKSRRPSGTAATRAALGTQNTRGISGRIRSFMISCAKNAERIFSLIFGTLDFAQLFVAVPGSPGSIRIDMMNWFRVRSAAPSFGVTNTSDAYQKPAPVRVLGCFVESEKRPVYDLMIDDAHEFFADGHLVHNCIWGATHLLLNDHLIAMAPPILVGYSLPGPERGPAPVYREPRGPMIDLTPGDYEHLTDTRGW